MGFRRLDSLIDIARKGYWVKLACECGHTAKRSPEELIQIILSHGGGVRLTDLHKSLVCSQCGERKFSAEHCQGPEIWSG
jgi:hypothetical protein